MISQVGSSMPEPIPAFLAMHHFQAPELKKKQFWHGLACYGQFFEGVLKITYFGDPNAFLCSHRGRLSFKAPPRITAVQPGENDTEAALTNAQLKF